MTMNALEDFILETRIDVTKIQEALDISGMSRKVDASIFNIVSSTFKDQWIKHLLLPTLAIVW